LKKILTSIGLLSALTLGGTLSVFAEDGAVYDTNGIVSFIPGENTPPVHPITPDPNDPVKPSNPDGTDPQPGTGGPLSIDFVSSFDFGNHPLSNKDETYSAKAQKYSDGTTHTPNYVQVSDLRGTNAGWVLTVKQLDEFKSTTQTKHDTLKGAAISLTTNRVSSNSEEEAPDAFEINSLTPLAETTVMQADNGKGSGTWVNRWGEAEHVIDVELTDKDGNKYMDKVTPTVSLTVPGKYMKDAVKYRVSLQWSLSELPENE
jgi:hypothetical protein